MRWSSQALTGALGAFLLAIQYRTTDTGLAQFWKAGVTMMPSSVDTAKRIDIAIVGMAARFPGAANTEQFWANLRAGVESIRQLSEAELLEAGVSHSTLRDPAYVRSCSMLEDIDKFDPAFFGLNARDASIMDPAHRIFLEVAWHAFEHAGYSATPEEGVVGVFATAGAPLYMMENVRTNRDIMRSVGEFLVRHTGNDMNFLATRVSYEMDLRGPSMNVQTACSSSLVSVHLACQSLARGECDMALAGGSTVLVPHVRGYFFREGEILSPDGHCRPFDAASAGTVFGSGAGAVVLKRLDDALDDGDTIHAVIRGSAVNNDGKVKVSYLAPGVDGQAAVIRAALRDAGVTPDQISYVEAHGTGTLVGDPIEVEALKEAYRSHPARVNACALGSVKSNIGHLGEAAGIASLIKAVMALKHRELPAVLGFNRLNPAIDLSGAPFFVNDRLRPWNTEGRRYCGVTALGAGGTNCHVVLEEAPEALVGEGDRSQHLLVLSAKSAAALDRLSADLAARLEQDPGLSLADAAYTLAVGRRGMAFRRAVVASSAGQASQRLREKSLAHSSVAMAPEHAPQLVFMFPGGGAQYAGMGRDLYEEDDVFREAIEECLAIINPALGLDLRVLMYPVSETAESATRDLERPSLTLPSLFATEYALARMFMAWGVTPAAMIGHSVGEYVAACLSGVLTLEEALRLVLMRGRLFEAVQTGRMLSVPLSEQSLRDLMPAGLDIAAANAPGLSVASGPSEGIAELERILEGRGIECSPVHINVAAHSSMLDPVLEQFRDLCRTIRFKEPKRPFVSNVTGGWITSDQATSPDYWVQHLRSTVRFSEGLKTISRLGDVVLLEAGPGRTLSTLARAQAAPLHKAFNCVRHASETASDLSYALACLGRMWTAGVRLDWPSFYDGQLRNRIPLPVYPFERGSYWVSPALTAAENSQADMQRYSDIASWFQTTGYVEAPLVANAPSSAAGIWLVLTEDLAGARRLTRQIGEGRFIIAKSGKTFIEGLDGVWRMDFTNADHHLRMIRYMEESVGLPDHVVFLSSPASQRDADGVFFPLVHLLQALGELSSRTQVSVITYGLTGADGGRIDPLRSLALGPVLVAPRELGHVETRCVDLPAGTPISYMHRSLLEMLARELIIAPREPIVAITAAGRWIRRLSPLALPQPPTETTVQWVRQGGVYLITGGLGGIGLEVAEYLARSTSVRLALMSRSALPPKEEWTRVIHERPHSRHARQIARLQRIQELGSEVITISGDVSERSAVAAAVREVREAFGPINGIIHSAGIMDDAPIMSKTAQAIKSVLAPKVAGALALDREITEPLDFFVLFSSIASYLGLPGQVDYTAANAFLDAFARDRARRTAGRTIVINWNAWRDVGMAAVSVGMLSGNAEPEHPSAYPVFEGYTDRDSGRVIAARFAGGADWLLREHVVRNGPAVLPGTAFIELARAACTEGGSSSPLELSDFVFVSPFRAEGVVAPRLNIQLSPAPAGFSVTMRTGGETGRQPIVTGEARFIEAARPEPLDLAHIRARCEIRQFVPPDQRLDQVFMDFGPRWANIVRTSFGKSEALVELSLPEPFMEDLVHYEMHPALLDMATGAAQALIPGADLTRDFYVPLGYGRVRLFGRMPGHVFSHVRLLPETGNGMAGFDVTLTDAGGEVIAEISRFMMRRVDARTIFSGADVASMTQSVDMVEAALADGIRVDEGLEALTRIMGQPGIRQVIASSVDLNAWNLRLDMPVVRPVVEADADNGFDRPPGAPAFIAPSTTTERTLAKIWSDLLGYRSIGRQDNFFDLGGNSLLGVRLFAAVRKHFSVSLPLATLFQAQTVGELASLIADPREESLTSPEGWSPMVCLKRGAPGHSPVFFIHGSRGNVLVFKGFADRVGPEQPVYALQAAGVDGAMAPDTTIESMAERYLTAIRSVQPEGPYQLAGYSGGGVIAYEIARRLKLTGEETKLLMLIDTLEPGQMRTPISLTDRLVNMHRVKPSRFIRLPETLWAYWLKPRIRKAMGAEDRPRLRTPLEVASDAVDAAYKTAQWSYQTPELEIDAVLIRATDARMQFLRSGPTLGWSRYIQGEIRRYDVDAEHDFIFEGVALTQLLAAFHDVSRKQTKPLA